MSAPAGLEFPSDYPVKVLRRPQPGFRERVHAIVLRDAPALGPEHVSERLSANRLRAESRAQIEALVG